MSKTKRAYKYRYYPTDGFKWDGKHLTLAKIDEPLDIHVHRDQPKDGKPSSVTITKDGANRYFVSMLVEEEIQPLPVVDKQVGLDRGLTSMVILSTGEAVGNSRYYAKDEKRLAKARRVTPVEAGKSRS